MNGSIIVIAGLGALTASVALIACSKESTTLPQDTLQTAKTKFVLIPVGDHQMILSSTADSSTSICVLDWGHRMRPDIDVKAPVEHFQLDNEGRDLVVISGGKATLRFSVRDDVTSASGETIVPVIGISNIGDVAGFDMTVLTSGAGDNAFSLVRQARLSESHGGEKAPGNGNPQTPQAHCCAGGPGSSSCSSSGEKYRCSVSCDAGYYACCDCSGMECGCVRA